MYCNSSSYKIAVVFHQWLTCSEHVKYLVGKVSKRIILLRHTRNNLSLYTANVICKLLILPLIDYCDNVWGCCGKVNSDKLEKLQRGTAHIVIRTHRNDDALKFLKYEPLKIRRDHYLLRLVKCCLKKCCPQMFMITSFLIKMLLRDILDIAIF